VSPTGGCIDGIVVFATALAWLSNIVLTIEFIHHVREYEDLVSTRKNGLNLNCVLTNDRHAHALSL